MNLVYGRDSRERERERRDATKRKKWTQTALYKEQNEGRELKLNGDRSLFSLTPPTLFSHSPSHFFFFPALVTCPCISVRVRDPRYDRCTIYPLLLLIYSTSLLPHSAASASLLVLPGQHGQHRRVLPPVPPLSTLLHVAKPYRPLDVS